jgi:hypothetical protein
MINLNFKFVFFLFVPAQILSLNLNTEQLHMLVHLREDELRDKYKAYLTL